jgi:3-hydroxyisobutyrate dehydrogenase-like beta-hydroxyacid dehydrogenase
MSAAKGSSSAVRKQEMTDVIGFIGLGAMGAGISRRLAATGVPLWIHDINAAAVEKLAPVAKGIAHSPKEIGDHANIVFISLPSLNAEEEVVLGNDGLVHGKVIKIVIDLSTTGARFAEKMFDAARKRGITYLASPISGGVDGAAAGTLAVMSSGPEDAYKKVRPYIESFGKGIHYLGEKPGNAQTMKLINNMLSTTGLVMACEAFVFGTKAGLDPDAMLDVINSGTGRNSATLYKFPKSILPRTFNYGAKTAITEKDNQLTLDEADALGVDLSIAKAAQKVWQSIIDQGAGDEDNTVLMKYLEKQAGVVVQGKAAKERKNSRG